MVHFQIADHMRVATLQVVSKSEVLIAQLIDLYAQPLQFVTFLAAATAVTGRSNVNKKTGYKYTHCEGCHEWDQPLYPSCTTHDLENLLTLEYVGCEKSDSRHRNFILRPIRAKRQVVLVWCRDAGFRCPRALIALQSNLSDRLSLRQAARKAARHRNY